MRLYEGMFLMDPALSSDWSAAETEINRVLQRAEAKVVGIKNWDERKLAYPINRHKRGLYALSYFQAAPEKIAGLERDVQLSEKLLRVLVVRREKMTEVDIEKSLTAIPPKPPSRYEDRGGRWGGGGSRFDKRPSEREEPAKEAKKEESSPPDTTQDSKPPKPDAPSPELGGTDEKEIASDTEK